jgi:hypothetical protein
MGHPRSVAVGVESLLCNDGEFHLKGTADDEIQVISDTCLLGGPVCQFRIVRQWIEVLMMPHNVTRFVPWRHLTSLDVT